MCLCTCMYVCEYISVFPCSNGSVLADYEVQLIDTSSDAEVQRVLANYVNAHNGKLGVLTVIVSSS